MKWTPTHFNSYRIDSARLRGYDYAKSGWYFVTVVTNGRNEIFGAVKNEIMGLSEFGIFVYECWDKIESFFPHVTTDAFVVMPNHVHGIINIRKRIGFDPGIGIAPVDGVAPGRDVGRPYVSTPYNRDTGNDTNNGNDANTARNFMSEISPANGSLSAIVRTFKSMVTKLVRDSGFNGPVWQSRYHDHIIRDPAELNRIRAYINDNPRAWQRDRNNPHAAKRRQ